jgi:hypothetical protein
VRPPSAFATPCAATSFRVRRPVAEKSTRAPLYLRLTRKEARLREDQIESLRKLARKLSRTRDKGTERLTENSLLRVAVDLLLARAGEITGTTEAEIRKSSLGE